MMFLGQNLFHTKVLVWLYLPDPWNLTCCEIVFLWHFFFCAKSEEARLPCWLEEEAATVEFLCPAKIIIMITRPIWPARPRIGSWGGARIQFKWLHFGVFSRLALLVQCSPKIGYCCSNFWELLKTGRLKHLGTNLDQSISADMDRSKILRFISTMRKCWLFLSDVGLQLALLSNW